jgi:hypothetical protein
VVNAIITPDLESCVGKWDEESSEGNSSITRSIRETSVRNYPPRRLSLSFQAGIPAKASDDPDPILPA